MSEEGERGGGEGEWGGGGGVCFFFFFNDTATTEIYTLSLHDALPIFVDVEGLRGFVPRSHLSESEDLESQVGNTLSVAFLEVNQENNKLVMSQRLEIGRAHV